MIDFRSDTVTKPSAAMLAAMMAAPVGDDVFGEDPTINTLEAVTAEMFGFEAAIFCPSGTMTNQIAIRVHTQPGHEVICDKNSHVYQYEGGGIAVNSLCSVKLLDGINGKITADQVEAAINPNDIHKPISSLVCLENTVNRGGGGYYSINTIQQIKEVCKKNSLQLHLDGARVFNAIVANNENPKQYGELFNSVSICLSKGLGAPVGSVLLGTYSFIQKARRFRKLMGGGMRQAGILAAAGLYALEHNIKRLEIDHINAKKIAEALEQKDFIGKILPVETNIIIAEITGRYNPTSLVEEFKKNNIYSLAFSPTQIRMVLHLDITPAMVEETIQVIQEL